MKFVFDFCIIIFFGFILTYMQCQVTDDFQEVVRQKTRGNQIQQCPCVIHPESRQCITYDSRYIAVSYEEAILAFLDLSKHNYKASLVNVNSFECHTEQCQQCFSLLYYKLSEVGLIPPLYKSSISLIPRSNLKPSLCSKYNFNNPPRNLPAPPTPVSPHLQMFINAGKSYRTSQKVTSGQNSLEQIAQSGVNVQRNMDNTIQQQRTRFRNNQAQINRFNGQQRLNFVNNRNHQNLQQRQRFQPMTQQASRFHPLPQNSFNSFQHANPEHRWNGRYWEPISAISGFARGWNGATPSIQPPHPGAIAPVQSSFSGGGSIGNIGGVGGGGGGNNDHMSSFFPSIGFQKRAKREEAPVVGNRFIISCIDRGDSEDEMLALCGSCWTWRQLPESYFPRIINELSCKSGDFCLSGWGECVQQYRNIDVLRRENGKWIPTVITTSTCCDCRVRAGTEIHSLVIGDKK